MLPMAFWRDAPAQHFATPTGDFEWSQETSDCTEPKDVKLLPNNQLKSPMGTGQVITSKAEKDKSFVYEPL